MFYGLDSCLIYDCTVDLSFQTQVLVYVQVPQHSNLAYKEGLVRIGYSLYSLGQNRLRNSDLGVSD